MECLSLWTLRTTSTVSKTTTRKEDVSLPCTLMKWDRCMRIWRCDTYHDTEIIFYATRTVGSAFVFITILLKSNIIALLFVQSEQRN